MKTVQKDKEGICNKAYCHNPRVDGRTDCSYHKYAKIQSKQNNED